MIDQIGGWSSGKVGEGYGEGFTLSIEAAYLESILSDDPAAAIHNIENHPLEAPQERCG